MQYGNRENVFILEFISYNIIRSFCVDFQEKDCTLLDRKHDYVKLAQSMGIGDTKYLNGQNILVKLLYKGKNVLYIEPKIKSFNNYYYKNYYSNDEIFVNVKNTPQVDFNKIYFQFYYRPGKWREERISHDLILGLKRYPGYEYEYYDKYSFFKNIFIKYFLNKYRLSSYDCICCVPGHKKSNINCNSIALMIGEICENRHLVDGSQFLLRTKSIPEQKSFEGKRYKEIHYSSIMVNANVVGKRIILIDDITTSGNSLLACRDLLMKAGAKCVLCFAFGKSS